MAERGLQVERRAPDETRTRSDFWFSCHEDNYELHNIMAESKMEENAETEPQ